MLETIRNAWKIPDLRKKILYTILLLVVFRFGSAIPVPGIEPEALKALFSSSDSVFGILNLISGNAMQQMTIFALGISPYINASIILNLLTVAIPALERMQREDRKKIAQLTRYATIILAILQGSGFYALLSNANGLKNPGVFSFIVILSTFTAGSALLRWLGEQITEKGIGNGISLIIFAGIVSRIPAGLTSVWNNYLAGKSLISAGSLKALLILVVALAAVVLVVLFNDAERRIQVQYAKRVVGRKMYGGQNTHIPLKVTMAGVIPIIFAMSLMSLPATILQLVNPTYLQNPPTWFRMIFTSGGWVYALIYFLLIVGFTYFYTSIQVNPIEMSNNIKNNGGFIPGIRPGRPTSDYIAKVISRITCVGALFLGLIAVLPMVLEWVGFTGISFGGSSLLIIVGVALETVKQLESQMLMRHYKGFLN